MSRNGGGQSTIRKWGLKGKLVLAMLLVGLIPLLIGLAMSFIQGTREIEEVSGSSFSGLARETARKLDLVLSEEVAKNVRISTDTQVVQALESRRDELMAMSDTQRSAYLDRQAEAWDAKDPRLTEAITQHSLAEVLRQYQTGTYRDPAHPMPVEMRSPTRALFVTDSRGSLVASINSDVGYRHDGEAWWQGAFKGGVGQPYLGPLYFDERLNRYVFSLSLPVMDRVRYEAIGVLHRVYDAKEFLDPAVYPVRFGKTGHAMLIDSEGTVLSCPVLPTGVRVPDESLIPLVTGVLPGWTKAGSDGHGGTQTSIIGYAQLPETSRMARASTGGSWHMFVWQSSEELFAPVQHLLSWIAAVGVVAIGLLVGIGYLVASRVVTPIRRLQEAAKRVGRGEFQPPLTLQTEDEIQELAEEFNRMNARLQASFAGLSDQIELKEQEAKYLKESTDQILDSVPDPVVILDSQGRTEYMNSAARSAFQLGVGPSADATLFDVLPIDGPTKASLRADFHRYAAAQDNGSGTEEEREDGPVEPRDPLSPRSIAKPKPPRREIQIGSRIYRYDWFVVTGPSEDARRFGYVLRDTTDESRTHDQMIQAEKADSLGLLCAGIGHELNNPLYSLMGLGEAIQQEGDPSRIKAMAKDIVQHGRRMASIIQDFTGLAQVEAKAQWVEVDVNELLKQALQQVLLLHESEHLTIHTRLGDLPKLMGKPDDIRQALTTVITNAIQAMHGTGRLALTTETEQGLIKIKVQDSGPGIPKSYLNRVFDPFFTTKGPGSGSGLGLTVARRIMKKYGGQIELQSEEGQGTICVLAFPVHEISTVKDRS